MLFIFSFNTFFSYLNKNLFFKTLFSSLQKKLPEVCEELHRSGQLGPIGRCFFRCWMPRWHHASPVVKSPQVTGETVPGKTPQNDGGLPGLLGNVQPGNKKA